MMPAKYAYVFSLTENRAIDILTGGAEALRDGKSDGNTEIINANGIKIKLVKC